MRSSCTRTVLTELNPFTAPVCNISRLKDAGTCLQTSIFSGPVTSTVNAVRFDESPFTCQCEEGDKKA